MDKTINKFLLVGNKSVHEVHLNQPGFTYSACEPFTKQIERNQKFQETGNLKHIFKSELDKTAFSYDAVYSDIKDIAKGTISDEILKDRAYQIAINPKYGYQRGMTSMVYKFLTRKQEYR